MSELETALWDGWHLRIGLWNVLDKKQFRARLEKSAGDSPIPERQVGGEICDTLDEALVSLEGKLQTNYRLTKPHLSRLGE